VIIDGRQTLALEVVEGVYCRTVAGTLLAALGYGEELELVVLELQSGMSCYCLLSFLALRTQAMSLG